MEHANIHWSSNRYDQSKWFFLSVPLEIKFNPLPGLTMGKILPPIQRYEFFFLHLWRHFLNIKTLTSYCCAAKFKWVKSLHEASTSHVDECRNAATMQNFLFTNEVKQQLDIEPSVTENPGFFRKDKLLNHKNPTWLLHLHLFGH